MEVLPFLYIGLVFVISSIGHASVLGKWAFFWICLLLTPLIGLVIYALLPKRPKAVCMMPLKNFEIGMTYHYKIINQFGGVKKVKIFNGYMEEISLYEFSECFSEIRPINEPKLNDILESKMD